MTNELRGKRATRGSRCRVVAIFLACALLCAAVQAAGQTNPVPFVSDPLVPSSAVPGGAGFTLTVNGTGFVSGSVVNWNGATRTTTFLNSSQVTATIPASDVATAGTASVTVSNPAPGGGSSNVTCFEITLPPEELLFHFSNIATSDAGLGGFVSGDFNRDGKLDVAVFQTGPSSSVMAVLLGKGNGAFSKAITMKMPANAGDPVAGDFNDDGILDLAFVSGIRNAVFVLLGKGDGTFTSLPPTKMNQSPNLMAVGDFNRDGKLDLVTSNGNDNGISILLGNGDGTFQPEIDITGIPVPFFMAVGDFNRDGKLDIVVVEAGSGFAVFLGNGDGTFTAGTTYASPNALSIVAADLNGDGNLDLVVVNGSDSQQGDWEVFLGDGDGTFQRRVDYSPSGGFDSAAVSDMDGDGKLDVIASGGSFGTYAGMLAVFPGNGDGTFQTPLTYPTGQVPSLSATGDINGDGRLDLIFESIATPSSYRAFVQVPAVFAPTSVSFGKVAVGSTSRSQSVVLTNAGGPPLVISGISVKGTDPGDFTATNNCPSNLAAGANCTVSVTFSPSTKGTRSASVSVSFGGGAIPQGFTVRGTGQ
jgi:hypothetical protein